jgi:DNA mismatch endonuclease (patch repair protein)
MSDSLSKEQRSARMGMVRSKNTSPELLVRKIVHGLGFRYRLHVKDLPGCPDLVFPRLSRVIFVHGCFWHRHKKKSCKLARLPKSRLDFWVPKLEGNRLRDLRTKRKLRSTGWDVLEVWECDLSNLEALKAKIRYFLENEIA